MQRGKIINNVSTTTAIDLKAELAQQVEQFEKVRSSTGKQVAASRPEKKVTVWSRQNKGVNDRNKRDAAQQLQAVESDTLARSREQLEKKAKIYEAMRSGKYRVEDEDDEEKMPLIDFDRKYMQERELEIAKESKRNEKKRKHNDDEEDDPWVEYEDEFGRTRIVRRSEVPRRSSSPYNSEDEEYDENCNGPRISQTRIDAASREDMEHYEAHREIRTKGVGFYSFSLDEQERRDQLAKLNKIRAETENARQSQASAASKRKQMLAQNAEKIRARKAALKAKKHHQLKPEQQKEETAPAPVVTEDSVNDFLKSVRKQVE